MIQALLVTICLAILPYQGSSIILEAGKVNDYEVVYPQKIPALPRGRIERREQRMKYEHTMKYEFKVNGEPVVLHLEKNRQLFSKDYTETHYAPDGRQITTSPQVEDHCYYHGYIQNDADSSAVISACEGLNGYFKNNGEVYLIEPLTFSDNEAHAVYKYESLEKEDETPKNCGAIDSSRKSYEPIKETSKIFSTPEDKEEFLKTKKYVELYMVVDNVLFRKYDRNIATIRRRVSDLLNHLNYFFKRLNIYVVLVGLDVWSDEDKILINATSETTVEAFAAWRHFDLLPRKNNDNALLLTGVYLEGLTLGIAFIGAMCDDRKSVAISQDNNNKATLVATIMTHEMGHNLGMSHDRNSCTCNKGLCIMKPTIDYYPPSEFSSCSLWYYEMFVTGEEAQCILNVPLITDNILTPVCGNDVMEEGEECDCGPPETCDNKCCEAATCTLKPEAQCAGGACCEKCQFKRAGELCQAAKGDCDLPEFCTGQDAECPWNRFQEDGHPCRNNLGICVQGTCPTLEKQCIALFGPGAKVAPDKCFTNNEKGNSYGYCEKKNNTNIPCEPKDVKCGRLYCIGTENDSCQYGFSEGNPDYGMVELGTKCGEGMICVFGKCTLIETETETTIGPST